VCLRLQLGVGRQCPVHLQLDLLAGGGGDYAIKTTAPTRHDQYWCCDSLPWGLGGQFQGKTVTVAAWYGLGTVGHPGDAGKPWLGRRNIPLKDGTLLDHIQHRPMWIIDYGNMVAYGAGAPKKPAPVYNHTVYLVDAQTRTVLEVRFYQGA